MPSSSEWKKFFIKQYCSHIKHRHSNDKPDSSPRHSYSCNISCLSLFFRDMTHRKRQAIFNSVMLMKTPPHLVLPDGSWVNSDRYLSECNQPASRGSPEQEIQIRRGSPHPSSFPQLQAYLQSIVGSDATLLHGPKDLFSVYQHGWFNPMCCLYSGASHQASCL